MHFFITTTLSSTISLRLNVFDEHNEKIKKRLSVFDKMRSRKRELKASENFAKKHNEKEFNFVFSIVSIE